jgi:hypothetical protein
MGFLTDRAFITGITKTNLIHVVDVNDVSQGNPDGSSYKASILQLQNALNTLNCSGVTTSSLTISQGTDYYGVNYNGNVDLTLFNPTGLDGVHLFIKDEGGYAETYRIRIYGGAYLIDNHSYVDMNINNMSLHLIARNNGWWII